MISGHSCRSCDSLPVAEETIRPSVNLMWNLARGQSRGLDGGLLAELTDAVRRATVVGGNLGHPGNPALSVATEAVGHTRQRMR